jgi:hypothetical protein
VCGWGRYGNHSPTPLLPNLGRSARGRAPRKVAAPGTQVRAQVRRGDSQYTDDVVGACTKRQYEASHTNPNKRPGARGPWRRVFAWVALFLVLASAGATRGVCGPTLPGLRPFPPLPRPRAGLGGRRGHFPDGAHGHFALRLSNVKPWSADTVDATFQPWPPPFQRSETVLAADRHYARSMATTTARNADSSLEASIACVSASNLLSFRSPALAADDSAHD